MSAQPVDDNSRVGGERGHASYIFIIKTNYKRAKILLNTRMRCFLTLDYHGERVPTMDIAKRIVECATPFIAWGEAYPTVSIFQINYQNRSRILDTEDITSS